jgi:isocitrate dehydrogenase (NAD+)
VLGSQGVNVTDDLAIDFTATTSQGSERIIRLAFEYARRNKINRVTMVTKANIVKTTDGKFLSIGYEIAKEYPEVQCDDWYIDIMTAKLVDPKRRSFRAASGRRGARTSGSSMRCSRRSTGQRRGW